tara:strand:+ start:311 stop:544 length:234 start_codon:yes stop_codon:yes gene_type:complete
LSRSCRFRTEAVDGHGDAAAASGDDADRDALVLHSNIVSATEDSGVEEYSLCKVATRYIHLLSGLNAYFKHTQPQTA